MCIIGQMMKKKTTAAETIINLGLIRVCLSWILTTTIVLGVFNDGNGVLAEAAEVAKFDESIYLPQLTLYDNLEMEVAIFVDESMYKMYSRNFTESYADYKLTEYVKTVMNDIQLLYLNPYLTPKITFKVVKYDVYRYQPKELRPRDDKLVYAEEYLKQFCMFQYNMPDRDWDHSILFTGYDVAQGDRDFRITGASRTGGVCDPYNSCTLLEGFDFTAPLVGAHEIAHALGVEHDEPRCPSTFIMSNKLGGGKIGWSTCSIEDLHKHLTELDKTGYNCLRETKNAKSAFDLDGLLLPGVKYNAHEQCSLKLGAGHIMVHLNRGPIPDSPCYEAICTSASSSIFTTTHPALEGTMCGDMKYCKHGQCVNFPFNPTGYPKAVDGGWSSWKRMPCHECSCSSIIGSIGVLHSSRDCNNPEPADNGHQCPGYSLRGIVCNTNCQYTKFSPKTYVKAVCEKRRRENQEASLTGDGFRLIGSPCKIHCATNIDSKQYLNQYRFFNDFMPNGSPCGNDQYCVDGHCLNLSCNKKALLGDKETCPSDESEYCDVKKKSDWQNWGPWSGCSVTCDSGVRQRRRYCNGDGCQSRTETTTEPCQRSSCDALKDYTETLTHWSQWSQCSASCGQGTTSRQRQCKSEVDDCSASELKTELRECWAVERDCPDPAMDWSDWSLWSRCSVSCGSGGRRVRQRFCATSGCPGRPEEVQPCSRPYC